MSMHTILISGDRMAQEQGIIAAVLQELGMERSLIERMTKQRVVPNHQKKAD